MIFPKIGTFDKTMKKTIGNLRKMVFELDTFLLLEEKGLARVIQMDGVGCEKFAERVYYYVGSIVNDQTEGRVKLKRVNHMLLVKELAYRSGIYSIILQRD